MNGGTGKRSTYHKIAYDVLQSRRPQSAVDSLLEAAEIGDDKKLMELVSKYRTIINLKCVSSGDTALITAARNGHSNIVEYLMKSGADPTLQNDIGENALDVGPPHIRDILLCTQLSKERPSTANRLLQAAWLGDSVTVKKNLSGGIINVNCKNSEGLTPLLLVTRDIKTFDKVHRVMKTDYDPLGVMQELLKHKADLRACDSNGRTALHLISNEGSSSVGAVQAKKVVSLLLQNGSSTNITDKNGYTPLHIAAKNGHTAIIVALLEEGETDIDCRGGENRDTPLIISVREGHKETAEYLLSKGADVTLTADSGDTALSVAKTSSMTALIKDAWDKSIASEPIGVPCEGSGTESDSNTDINTDLNADTDTDTDLAGTVTAPFFITQNNVTGIN
uniref:Uncharacterized protein n=1 Tax=Amphimedon queenslandica TaxID=400682 RepID=A0A1X7STF0_AMPQE